MEQAGDACDIVIVGSKADQARARRGDRRGGLGRADPLAGRRGAACACDVRSPLKEANVVLTNSTMLMHVAAACFAVRPLP
ncbi:hypothetical protein ACFFYR_11900 [Paraburkholderia dipogonis]